MPENLWFAYLVLKLIFFQWLVLVNDLLLPLAELQQALHAFEMILLVVLVREVVVDGPLQELVGHLHVVILLGGGGRGGRIRAGELLLPRVHLVHLVHAQRDGGLDRGVGDTAGV